MIKQAKHIAGIDIGSNAVRLAIDSHFPHQQASNFSRQAYLRIPLRLHDFSRGENFISAKSQARLILSLQAFRDILQAFEVAAYLGVATSAMRDAANKQPVLDEIKAKTGLNIKVLTGDQEAALTTEGLLARLPGLNLPVVHFDIGGGSSEISFIDQQAVVRSASFDIGTVRLLENPHLDFSQADEFIAQCLSASFEECIFSGGAVDMVYDICSQQHKLLQLSAVKLLSRKIENKSAAEIALNYQLNADRSTLVKPALAIIYHFMKLLKVESVRVPKIGLLDALILRAYRQFLV